MQLSFIILTYLFEIKDAIVIYYLNLFIRIYLQINLFGIKDAILRLLNKSALFKEGFYFHSDQFLFLSICILIL